MELAGEPPVSEGPGAIDFRVAGVDDLPVLAQLDVACFGGPLEKAQISADRIRKPNFLGLLGIFEGEPVGKTLVSFEEDSSFVCGLCVRPTEQGRGFGRAILREAILRAKAKSSLPVRLEVACENPRALGLYQSCGFRTTSTYDYYALDLPNVAVGE
jgi:ribosomal protein S18 acetylase RimI-like enzyme